MADVVSRRGRGALVLQSLEQENDDVPQDRHRLRRRPFPDPAGILPERAVAHPMQAVLDTPVAPDQSQQLLRAGLLARQARDPQYDLGLDLLARLTHPLQAEHLRTP